MSNSKLIICRLNEENDAKFRALSDRIKKVNKSEEMQCHRTVIHNLLFFSSRILGNHR